jgi:hypothetical protein
MADSTVEVYDDFSIIATRNNATSVEPKIQNLGTGYASRFITAPGEEGQLWSGGGYGLNIRTNTDSNISFQTGGYSSSNSMSILGSGIKSFLTTIDNAVGIGASMSSTSVGLIVSNNILCMRNLTVGGNTTITGNLSTTSFYGVKPWVSSKLVSGVMTVVGSPGLTQSGVTVTFSTVGSYLFVMPAHPHGTNYTVHVMQYVTNSTSALACYGVDVKTSTTFTIYSKTSANVGVASSFFFYTVP